MIKFTSNNDFDWDVQSVELLKDSNQLVKRASARHLLKYAKTPGQEDLHIIALGSYEGTGFNRNCDAFPEADCRKNHSYFVKAGRAIHRNHKNKPEDPKYGNIKASAYNEAMKRVELIIGLDRDKCADILDEQEKTGSTDWSMASKQVKGDWCSWCDHNARSEKDRCSHIPAKLGELNNEGVMCGMINKDPRWFEQSYVRRRADRIGVSLKKMASDSTLKPLSTGDYLALYPDLYVPSELEISKKACDKRVLLQKLAEVEKEIEGVAQGKPNSLKEKFLARHGAKMHGSPLSEKTMDELRKHDPAKLLKLLADDGIIFSPEDFSHYLFANRVKDENVKGMKTHLPDIFSNLHKDQDAEVVNNEKYEPSSMGSLPKELKSLIEKLSPDFSLEQEPGMKRIMRVMIICGGPSAEKPLRKETDEKTKLGFDQELAKQYASYKLAALNYLYENGKLTDDLIVNSLVQNRV